MRLNDDERAVVAFIRQFEDNPRLQIALLDFMHRWLSVDNHVQAELRRIHGDQRIEGVEQAAALLLRARTAQGLHGLQLDGREVGIASGDGLGMVAQAQEIISTDLEDAG